MENPNNSGRNSGRNSTSKSRDAGFSRGSGTGTGTVNNFSLAPCSSENPAEDSGMMDDNDLTTPLFLSARDNTNEGGGGGGGPPTDNNGARRLLRPHSSLRLVIRKIGNFIASFTLLTMLVIVPVVIYRALSRRKLDFAAFNSAGVMVLGTVVLSIRLVYLHFTHWYMPNVQKYVVRILWMVPLYAIQSWLSLRFREARIYIDTVRDLYEAFVISSFLYYLIELLGGQDRFVQALRAKSRNDPEAAHHLGSHTFPLNCVLERWELGVEFVLQCKHGVLQYVVVKTIASFLTFGFQWLGIYGEGQFKWNAAYPYMAFILNVSVMHALYCLVKLFHAVNDELRHPIDWHPLGKFLCVKGVVFFTWWQGVIIFYLQSHGIISDIGSWTGEEVANGLIDYCVCIEMVAFAIAHAYTFTYVEYLPSTVEQAMAAYEEDGQPSPTDGSSDQTPTYLPPDYLPRPMKFRHALLGSVLPSETLQDMRRLRGGVREVVNQVTDPGTISLQDMPLERANNATGSHQVV